MTNFDSGLPSTRQIQTLIKSQTPVEIKLTTGDTLQGKIRWQDSQCLGLIHDGEQTTLIRLLAIAYIAPQG